MEKLRLVFLGSKVWGLEGLKEALNHRDRYDIVAVFTNPAEQGSPDYAHFHGIMGLAKANGITAFPTPNREINSKESVERIRGLKPDVMLSMGWNALISNEILSISKANINVHSSLLPRYRGYNPNNWGIINGEKFAGMTAHEMVEKVDAGNVYSQKKVPIGDSDTIKEVHERSLSVLPAVVGGALGKAAKGDRGKPMDMKKASYYGRRGPEDGLIDWGQDAKALARLVRAVTRPYPGAFTYCEGRRLCVWKADESALKDYHGAPGQILVRSRKEGAVHVACGKGMLRVLEVQEEGKEATDAFGYFTGKGDRLGLVPELEIERLLRKVRELEERIVKLEGR